MYQDIRGAVALRPIYVPLPDEQIRRALVNVAEREFRDPRDQAAKYIVDGLRKAGALPAEPANPNRADNRTPVGAG